MQETSDTEEVRKLLEQFQNGYTERNIENLDAFISLFARSEDIELIGIGAFERGGIEWFEGIDKIREIIQSDWEYWGDVLIDVEGAKIHVKGDIAWMTTTGTLEQTDAFDKALPQYLDEMKMILEDKNKDADEKLLEASHFGVRRLRERLKGKGYRWPFVISAILIREAMQWRFHTIHWSMPVD